jgi:hypothetical protein
MLGLAQRLCSSKTSHPVPSTIDLLQDVSIDRQWPTRFFEYAPVHLLDDALLLLREVVVLQGVRLHVEEL